MKNLFFLSVLFLTVLLVLHSCKTNPCDGIVTYPKLDPRLPNYFYKPGSYWVYRDSVGGITDSQYVHSYLYRIHYRNPADTPNPYYQATATGITSSTYCGPYYLDDIQMRIYSNLNGVLTDSFFILSSSGGGAVAGVSEHGTAMQSSGTLEFILDWTKIGFLNCCDYITPQGDTTGTWYYGIQPSVSSGNYNFQNVQLWTVQIGDGSSPWFTHPTDLYITSGSGIIKMVQHLPTGDVKWNLINYHIVP
jgi:hypothetical protein